jgi:hypothetical protein
MGLMGAVTVELGATAVVDVPTGVLAAAAFLVLRRFDVNSAWLILAGAAVATLLVVAPVTVGRAAPPPGNPGNANGCDKKAQGQRCRDDDAPPPPGDTGDSTPSGSDDSSSAGDDSSSSSSDDGASGSNDSSSDSSSDSTPDTGGETGGDSSGPADDGASVDVGPSDSSTGAAARSEPVWQRPAVPPPSAPARPRYGYRPAGRATERPSGQVQRPASAPSVPERTVFTDASGWSASSSRLRFVANGIAGRRSLRVFLTQRASLFSVTIARALPVARRGATYRVRGWLRSERPGVTLCLRLQERTAAGRVVRTTEECISATKRWQHVFVGTQALARGHRIVASVYEFDTERGDRFDLDGFRLS